MTTDFGTQDWFVGVMKGVILGLASRATVIDLTHEIPLADVRAGALARGASFAWFPRGTIHVAVVDPGVGSARAALVGRTKNYYFVGPDNGVLSAALAKDSVQAVYRLDNPRYWLPRLSRTFHGRDLFAPLPGSRTQPITS